MHLPLLALECIRPRWSEPGLFAVVERERVVAVSPQAHAAGVALGMRAGGVAAVAPSTTLLPRAPERELAARQAAALALLQYTPEVALAGSEGLLLDVSASLTLFRGRLALARAMRASLAALGLSATLGMAPTSQGAWLLARQRREHGVPLRRRAVRMALLERLLDQLPATDLPAALPFAEWLSGIGAERIGALRRLPRQGIQRRMGRATLAQLDQAYGLAPELHEWLQVPEQFAARLETMERVEHAEALLDGATSLLAQLTGWLVSTHQAVAAFALLLEHERGRAAVPPSVIEVQLGQPAWRSEHLVRLLKERLGRTELVAPVIALQLEARQLRALAPPNGGLFPEPGGTAEDFQRLVELLSARLGSENVLAPAVVHDHRPEVRNAWLPLAMLGRRGERGPAQEQPFWLLPKPIPLLVRGDRPFYQSPLKMVSGPERVEAGWWNDQLAARDYYVAQADDATCYWIYLERVVNGHWHLHGIFA